MKREFAFDDALRMLEVMWSSLPPADATDDLPLYEVRFCSESQFLPPTSPSPRETPYTKVCALRRQPLSRKKLILNYSLDESVIARRRSHANFREKPKKYSSLDDNTFYGNHFNSSENSCGENSDVGKNDESVALSPTTSYSSDSSCEKYSDSNSTSLSCSVGRTSAPNKIVKNLSEFLTLEKRMTKKKLVNHTSAGNGIESCSTDGKDHGAVSENGRSPSTNDVDLENLEKRFVNVRLGVPDGNGAEEIFIWQNPLQEDLAQADAKSQPTESLFDRDGRAGKCLNGDFFLKKNLDLDSLKYQREIGLPSPKEFGGGNPFLMFLCIAVLCQHRDTIIKTGMDYNEIAMHFDKMVRKHNVSRVLNQARIMYLAYLKSHRENFIDV